MPEFEIHRTGYHGLMHEDSCRFAGRIARSENANNPPRILSVCMETRSEATAISGNKPFTVTGGATPLEGLMGDFSCGDMDPGILVKIAGHYHYGPEQVNKILTEESGFSGITGRKTTLLEVFGSHSQEDLIAQEMFIYKLLHACGTGMAAVGAFDYIVFSGKYSEVGDIIGPCLRKKLALIPGRKASHIPRILINSKTLEQVIAEKTRIIMKELHFIEKQDDVVSGYPV
ncbi:MAG: hypothetical protein HPY53_16355 [Brevinematales bacterium]|nr:hypothetical protein [Brevinematales bacterium]